MTTLHLIQSKRGAPAIIVHEYMYTKCNELNTGDIIWKCPKKTCYASVKTNDRPELLESRGTHKHDHLSSSDIEKLKIDVVLKRKAIEDPTVRPNKLIRRAIAVSEVVDMCDISNFRRHIYRQRRKSQPVLPKSIEDAVQQLTIRQNEIQTFKLERFVFVHDDNSIVAITCKTNLQCMCTSLPLFADGTFNYCPKYFYQIYTIHVYKNNIYLPLVYFLLNGKSTECYTKMWNFLKELCGSFNLSFKPNLIRVDFEISAHIAIKFVFPECKILGCKFHLGQSWYRKLNQDFPTLRNEYNNSESETGKWLKNFFGLSFLPYTEVSEAFCELIEISPSENALEFSDYVLKNYIDEDCLFPPEMWAEAPSSMPKTTNGPESFHRHFNEQFYSAHPSIWKVRSNY
ncbi:uncharacterized protein LOC132944652 [Metopolophium dirhodum]|uniref:uncharacterized protein LOC132944652 n=1 Tax=Metopolophium dirhodum TaxID=44670 RepID=UPI00298F6CEB|nr:uncharacterized protein LOC132944652 [Metopolophium dirhodum]